jgi:hypothetical protein
VNPALVVTGVGARARGARAGGSTKYRGLQLRPCRTGRAALQQRLVPPRGLVFKSGGIAKMYVPTPLFVARERPRSPPNTTGTQRGEVAHLRYCFGAKQPKTPERTQPHAEFPATPGQTHSCRPCTKGLWQRGWPGEVPVHVQAVAEHGEAQTWHGASLKGLHALQLQTRDCAHTGLQHPEHPRVCSQGYRALRPRRLGAGAIRLPLRDQG